MVVCLSGLCFTQCQVSEQMHTFGLEGMLPAQSSCAALLMCMHGGLHRVSMMYGGLLARNLQVPSWVRNEVLRCALVDANMLSKVHAAGHALATQVFPLPVDACSHVSRHSAAALTNCWLPCSTEDTCLAQASGHCQVLIAMPAGFLFIWLCWQHALHP
jgi:hypothetical protein